MSTRHHRPTLEEINAYVDGELDAPAHAAVRAHLSEHPDDVERVTVYRQQDQALRGAFGPFNEGPRIARLSRRLRSHQRVRRNRRLGFAAALACVAIALSALWWQRRTPPMNAPALWAQDAMQAYRLYAAPALRHPPPAVTSHGQALDRWLSATLGHPIHAPDLSRFGYRLAAIRLSPGTRSPAVQFMFEDQAGHRVACYFTARPGAGDTPSRQRSDDGVTTFYRIDDAVGYAISGNIDKARLRIIAQAAYQSSEAHDLP